MTNKSEKHGQGIEEHNKKIMAISVISVGVIITLIAMIFFLIMHEQENEPKRNVVVTKENAGEVADEMINQEYVEPGYYSVSMSTTWHFATGDSVSEDAYVENVKENTHDVYFDVFIEGNEEEAILKSPILPRGSELDNIALDAPLSEGTYDCVMIYHLVDGKQNTVSTLRVGVTIIVEK